MDEELARGRFLSLKKRNGWEFVERTNAREIVAVIAVTPEKELVLVEQYRPPVESRVIELPAGLVGDVEGDDSVEEAGGRELFGRDRLSCWFSQSGIQRPYFRRARPRSSR